MNALRDFLAGQPASRLALTLAAELDRLEADVYRTLSVGAAASEISLAARAAGLEAVSLRADLLVSDAASRAGAADSELIVQRTLLDQAQAAGHDALVRRASTYLASTCDRLGMRAESMGYAYAGLSTHEAHGDDDVDSLVTRSEGASSPPVGEAPAWRAEALMVVVLMSLSRPGADVMLIDRSVEIMRRDGRPVMIAATEANFAEMAAIIGRPDVAVRMAEEAAATISRHQDAEAVLTWESIAVARLAGGDLAGAEAALQRALEIETVLGISDSNGDPWVTFAELCLLAGRPADGLQVLDAPRRPVPTSSWVSARDFKIRARLHAGLEEWQTAYEMIEEHLTAYEQIRSIEGDRAVLTVESRVSMDEERERAREFQHQALTDPLTGLTNRRGVEQWLDRLSELERPSTMVAIVDVDHFKRINDRYSHETGDRVLERLSACLADTARLHLDAPCLVGRVGGEEFIVVWPSVSAAAGRVGAEQVRARAAALSLSDLVTGLAVTVSIGTTYVGDPRDLRGTPRAALMRADAALYRAKDAGRNAVRAG